MAANARNVVRVALQGLDALLCLVVPDLDNMVVWHNGEHKRSQSLSPPQECAELTCPRDQIWPIAPGEVLHTIHTLIVRLKGKVRLRSVQAPYFDRSVEGGASKRIRVLPAERKQPMGVGRRGAELGVLRPWG